MSAFDDLNEASFVAIEPAGKSVHRADLTLAFLRLRSAERMALSFQRDLLAEIGGPRYDVAWNAAKRLLLVKAGASARFEASAPAHHVSARIIVPVPSGLTFGDARCTPEFYVDVVGKRILIEVPAEFGQRLALPAPPPAPPPPVVSKPATVTDKEVTEGNREILQALGVTDSFPREFRGVSFTPAEARILEALFRGKELTMEALLAATHDPENGEDDRDVKIVAVWLCRMRPKLDRLGITVKTIWGGRRALDAASKGVIREMLREIEGAT